VFDVELEKCGAPREGTTGADVFLRKAEMRLIGVEIRLMTQS
jgi:hypothetical protein